MLASLTLTVSLLLLLTRRIHSQSPSGAVPIAITKNGTYAGVYQQSYGQDLFLGIPFAQPPVGSLRLSLPQGLNITWSDVRHATAYYPECVGYGGDQVGYDVSEDCLALNIIRPAGYEGQSLPVAVWIHGGGYVMGGTVDHRYNLTFIINNAVAMGKPIIAVSIAYRLSAFGFLDSDTIRAAGVTNLGIRDQRLALSWLQENIGAFGGDPAKITIWGESAGAGSVGIHLTAYGGRDDKLFRAAIGESGSPLLLGPSYNVTLGNSIYHKISQAAGCSGASDTLACLRGLDFNTFNTAVNVTPAYSFFPYVDGDLIRGSQYDQLVGGEFVRVPYLIGANTDEGSAFGPHGINTNEEFEAYLNNTGADYPTVKILQALYPNIPGLGVLETVDYIPNAIFGNQYKRAAAFAGDYFMHASKRLTCQQWAKHNAPAYSYRFNVIVNPLSPLIGSTHFQEVAFVFNNVQGLGYASNPFEGEPASFFELSKLMSNMWVSFIAEGDPNGHSIWGYEEWPVYDDGVGGYAEGWIFDANITSGPERDVYRGEAIAYMNSLWKSQWGK